ncbi:MAG: DUF6778 family protein [Bradyrhizobium sp.]|uniref:DUF3313 domain-containing protein n=2 Tax=Bradyrhizobium TaxID=374 RepID=A0ABS5G9E7_9BRAD|nr:MULTISPECIES: DUF6778 family protein [Bradyrhizobium]MBR1137943.1 hypothetical protein [Bradyrhizobium denitrificans]MDU1490612.1 DUF6778 family protein [Bradyrhizobium sp.]MDU1545658.1 DUF6778 family protein [Bradyrhizobium sp.]MDU1803119.1 DUF6778 family protein [Bradyrhizobium sp.]MDU3093119.1 DUF6778 family protein [Bradyrhizobium sp.]
MTERAGLASVHLGLPRAAQGRMAMMEACRGRARLLAGWARFAVLGLMLALCGCVTAENALTQTDIASMKLTAVAVSFTPNAFVSWDEGENDYGAAKGLSGPQLLEAMRTQEMKDYVRGMLGDRIKAGVEQALAGQLIGSRPVRLEIVVKRFKTPSGASRILIGSDPDMTASATLVDARTGAVVVAHPELVASVHRSGGLIGTAVTAAIDNARNETQEGLLIARYGRMYREWLTHGA